MTRKAVVVVGMGYGDEGKGTIVDYLAQQRDADTVVRFNGGAQAGHNVVSPDGIHHEFRQFGAGTFAGAATHLSRFCVVDPSALFLEAEQLQSKVPHNIWDNFTIDGNAAVVTPWHIAANKVRELARGVNRHGSCGFGIWETERDRRDGRGLVMWDLFHATEKEQRDMLRDIQRMKHDDVRDLLPHIPGGAGNIHARPFTDTHDILYLPDIYNILFGVAKVWDGLPITAQNIIFEGAQGILLDENVGFHPYTTGSTTTAANAIAYCAGDVEIEKIVGVTRAYSTRHGAGPFLAESPEINFPEPHNTIGDWQQGFRQGWLDTVMLTYAVDAEPDINEIAVTHMDTVADVSEELRVVSCYFDSEDEYYPHDPTPIESLHVPNNRTEQENMTKALMSGDLTACHRFEPAGEIPFVIEEATNKPVTLTSWGPTYEDKCERNPGPYIVDNSDFEVGTAAWA